MVHNAPLASALGKELHPPILSMLSIHGGLVKREREVGRVHQVLVNLTKTYVDVNTLKSVIFIAAAFTDCST